MLLITFDEYVTDSSTFHTIVTGDKRNNRFEGTIDTDRTGYVRRRPGKFDEKQQCFFYDNTEMCMLTLNANGIFFTGSNVNARLTMTPEGTLTGMTQMSGVSELIPTTIRILK